MDYVPFAELADQFLEIAHGQVWAAVATVDARNRPWTRVLHPIWSLDDGGAVGWVLTSRHSPKDKHLTYSPYASVAYVKDPVRPLTIECHAAWVDDRVEIERVWEWFKRTPEPLGYDPALSWKSIDDPEVGLLKLVPWRLTLGQLGGRWRGWRAD